MRTSEAYSGLACFDCDDRIGPEHPTHRCPNCGGVMDPVYNYESLELTRADLAARPFTSMWRYEEVLPFTAASAISLDEGATPLIECPDLADAVGIGRLLVKDEGRNPTGTFKDRGQSVAVTAAVGHGASAVALPSAGNAGQAAAAYSARADLDAHVFLPERAGFIQKAMVAVHGAELTVSGAGYSGSQIDDAVAEYAEQMDHNDWYSLQTFETPFRHEGKKTMGYEIIEQLDWNVPDAIVYPTGGGVGLVGIQKAVRELQAFGLIEKGPRLFAAQSTGCAPIVEAWEGGRTRHEPWGEVETVCDGVAVPDPGASPLILEAIRESDGGAVATTDAEILDGGLQAAQLEGLEMIPTAAATVSGAAELADRGELGSDDTVVLLDTGSGNKNADILRGHLADREASW